MGNQQGSVDKGEEIAEQIVREASHPNEPGVYVIGAFAQRVTIWSQQVRALNLVHALFAFKQVEPQSTIAVVGGGIGGMTAAAAAALRGCNVALLERQAQLLPLQQGNDSRWLHPHIYDWPDPRSQNEQADLPILTWTAGTSRQVARKILEQWKELMDQDQLQQHVRTLCNVQDLQLLPGNSPARTLLWNDDRGHHRETFKAIVLAVGFGVERQVGELPLLSYWRNDDINQPVLDRDHGARRFRYLVSGTGDGGLIDLLRVRIRDFQHVDVVHDFFPEGDPDSNELCRRLGRIQYAMKHGNHSDAWLSGQYQTLETDPKLRRAFEDLDHRIRTRLRDDTHATLNGDSVHPITHRTSMLNSFLAWRLLCIDVPYKQGRIAKSEQLATGALRVTFTRDAKETAPQEFDRVIARHGALSPLEESFPTLFERRNYWEMQRNMPIIPHYDPGEFPRPHRWIIDPHRAVCLLDRLGFRENSRVLRARSVKVARDGSSETINEADSKAIQDRSHAWRAGVIHALLELAGSTASTSTPLPCVLLRGRPGVGKTNLVLRYVASQWNPEHHCFLLDYASNANTMHEDPVRLESRRVFKDRIHQLVASHGGGASRITVIVDGLDAAARTLFAHGRVATLEEACRSELTEIKNILGRARGAAFDVRVMVTVDDFFVESMCGFLPSVVDQLFVVTRAELRPIEERRTSESPAEIADENGEESSPGGAALPGAPSSEHGKLPIYWDASRLADLSGAPQERREEPPAAQSLYMMLARVHPYHHERMGRRRHVYFQAMDELRHLIALAELHERRKASPADEPQRTLLEDDIFHRAVRVLRIEQTCHWLELTVDHVRLKDSVLGEFLVALHDYVLDPRHRWRYAVDGVLSNVVCVLCQSQIGPFRTPTPLRYELVDLRGAVFQKRDVKQVLFHRVDLSGAIFTRASVTPTQFEECFYVTERPPIFDGTALELAPSPPAASGAARSRTLVFKAAGA